MSWTRRPAGRFTVLAVTAALTAAVVAGCAQAPAPGTAGSREARESRSESTRPPRPATPAPSATAPDDSTASPEATPSPAAAVQQAARTTVEAGSARATLQNDLAIGGAVSRTTGEGVLDFAAGTGEMAYTGDDGETLRQILMPDAVYVQLPGDEEVWYESQWDETGLTPLGIADPAAALAALAEPGKVRQDGSEDIGGVPTTRYVMQVPVASVLAASGLSGEQIVASGAEIAQAPDAVVTAWIDDSGRVVQYQQDLALGEGADAISSSTLVGYADFGLDVEVLPPPGDQIVPAPEGMLGGDTEAGPAETGEGA